MARVDTMVVRFSIRSGMVFVFTKMNGKKTLRMKTVPMNMIEFQIGNNTRKNGANSSRKAITMSFIISPKPALYTLTSKVNRLELLWLITAKTPTTTSSDSNKKNWLIRTCTQTPIQVIGNNNMETSKFTICETKLASTSVRLLLLFVFRKMPTIRFRHNSNSTPVCSTKANNRNNMHGLCTCYICTTNEV